MNVIQEIKLALKIKSSVAEIQKDIKMKNTTKVVGAIFALITAILQVPEVQKAVLASIQAHPSVAAVIGGLSALLALFHVPVKAEGPGPVTPPPPPPSIKTAAMVVLALLLIPTLHAQTVTNFYAAGATYNVNASPSVAGTVLYAKKLADSNTYAFTALDMVPNTVKPYTVTTNMGVGVAQKLTTIGKVDIFTPLAAGISTSGPNLGWQYNFGIMPTIRIKGPYYIAPTVRFNKSSVSNGTGVQPLIGILFGFGQ